MPVSSKGVSKSRDKAKFEHYLRIECALEAKKYPFLTKTQIRQRIIATWKKKNISESKPKCGRKRKNSKKSDQATISDKTNVLKNIPVVSRPLVPLNVDFVSNNGALKRNSTENKEKKQVSFNKELYIRYRTASEDSTSSSTLRNRKNKKNKNCEMTLNSFSTTYKPYDSRKRKSQQKSSSDQLFDQIMNEKCSWSYRSQTSIQKDGKMEEHVTKNLYVQDTAIQNENDKTENDGEGSNYVIKFNKTSTPKNKEDNFPKDNKNFNDGLRKKKAKKYEEVLQEDSILEKSLNISLQSIDNSEERSGKKIVLTNENVALSNLSSNEDILKEKFILGNRENISSIHSPVKKSKEKTAPATVINENILSNSHSNEESLHEDLNPDENDNFSLQSMHSSEKRSEEKNSPVKANSVLSNSISNVEVLQDSTLRKSENISLQSMHNSVKRSKEKKPLVKVIHGDTVLPDSSSNEEIYQTRFSRQINNYDSDDKNDSLISSHRSPNADNPENITQNIKSMKTSPVVIKAVPYKKTVSANSEINKLNLVENIDTVTDFETNNTGNITNDFLRIERNNSNNDETEMQTFTETDSELFISNKRKEEQKEIQLQDKMIKKDKFSAGNFNHSSDFSTDLVVEDFLNGSFDINMYTKDSKKEDLHFTNSFKTMQKNDGNVLNETSTNKNVHGLYTPNSKIKQNTFKNSKKSFDNLYNSSSKSLKRKQTKENTKKRKMTEVKKNERVLSVKSKASEKSNSQMKDNFIQPFQMEGINNQMSDDIFTVVKINSTSDKDLQSKTKASTTRTRDARRQIQNTFLENNLATNSKNKCRSSLVASKKVKDMKTENYDENCLVLDEAYDNSDVVSTLNNLNENLDNYTKVLQSEGKSNYSIVENKHYKDINIIDVYSDNESIYIPKSEKAETKKQKKYQVLKNMLDDIHTMMESPLKEGTENNTNSVDLSMKKNEYSYKASKNSKKITPKHSENKGNTEIFLSKIREKNKLWQKNLVQNVKHSPGPLTRSKGKTWDMLEKELRGKLGAENDRVSEKKLVQESNIQNAKQSPVPFKRSKRKTWDMLEKELLGESDDETERVRKNKKVLQKKRNVQSDQRPVTRPKGKTWDMLEKELLGESDDETKRENKKVLQQKKNVQNDQRPVTRSKGKTWDMLEKELLGESDDKIEKGRENKKAVQKKKQNIKDDRIFVTRSRGKTWDMLEKELLGESDDDTFLGDNIYKTVILKKEKLVKKQNVNNADIYTVSKGSITQTLNKLANQTEYTMQYEMENTESNCLHKRSTITNYMKIGKTTPSVTKNASIVDRAIEAMNKCTEQFVPQVNTSQKEHTWGIFQLGVQSDDLDVNKETQFHSNAVSFIADKQEKCYKNEIISYVKKSTKRESKNFSKESNLLKKTDNFQNNLGYGIFRKNSEYESKFDNNVGNLENENQRQISVFKVNPWDRLINQLNLEVDNKKYSKTVSAEEINLVKPIKDEYRKSLKDIHVKQSRDSSASKMNLYEINVDKGGEITDGTTQLFQKNETQLPKHPSKPMLIRNADKRSKSDDECVRNLKGTMQETEKSKKNITQMQKNKLPRYKLQMVKNGSLKFKMNSRTNSTVSNSSKESTFLNNNKEIKAKSNKCSLYENTNKEKAEYKKYLRDLFSTPVNKATASKQTKKTSVKNKRTEKNIKRKFITDDDDIFSISSSDSEMDIKENKGSGLLWDLFEE